MFSLHRRYFCPSQIFFSHCYVQYAPVASPSPHQPLLTVNTQINTYSPHPRAHHSPAPAMSPHPQHQHYPQPQQQQQAGAIHYQYHPAQTAGQVNMVGKTLKVLPPVSSPMQQVKNINIFSLKDEDLCL